MADKRFLIFDIGPLKSVPTFISNELIDQWRNIGLSGECRSVEGTDSIGVNNNVKNVVWSTVQWTSPDPEGVFRDICGARIFTINQQTGKTEYTGNNLMFQYSVYQVALRDNSPVWYNLDFRVVIVTEQGVVVQQLGSTRFGLGYDGSDTRNLRIGFTAIESEYDGKHFTGVGIAANWMYHTDPLHRQIAFCLPVISTEWLESQYYILDIRESEDPNEMDPGGESEEGGGDGTFDRSSDSNPVPGYPAINGADAGFVRLYYTTSAILNLIASEVYSSNFFDWLAQITMKPTDVICGIGIVPFIPSLGDRGHHKFGTYTFTTELTSISSPYKTVDCGKLLIEEYYGSAFDYSPYTSIQIFLPFLGMRELDIDEVMGKEIGVVYHCNAYDGSLIAYITTPINGVDSVIAQYTGNCMQQVPFGAGDFSGCVRAALSIATSVVGSIAAAGAAGASLAKAGAEAGKVASGAVKAAGESAPSITDSISNVMGLKPHVEKASVAAGSPGQLACMKPFILRRIPRQSLPANYMELNGYPSNIGGKLSDFSGYAEIQQIQLSGVDLTEPEIAEILDTLKGGVII